MSLTTQIFLYQIDTSTFYCGIEKDIYKSLLKLYSIRKRLKSKAINKGRAMPFSDNDIYYKIKTVNKAVAIKKKELTKELNRHNKGVRILNAEQLKKQNIINLFESSLTRALGLKPWELTQDIVIVNVFFFQVFEDIVKQGFLWNGEKYIFLSASAGQIRQKKAVFIRESAYLPVKDKLMCGLTEEKINALGGINCNKYNAYLSLNNSATDVWQDFDIDKSIVVEDLETDVIGEVDYIDEATYAITRTTKAVTIKQTDGAGMMLDSPTRMCRLPWIKGLLVYFPFDRFIKERCIDGDVRVKDIYGKEHWIIAEDIRYIFTKSQFKNYKYYASWEEYKDCFKRFNCEACYCNAEEEKIPYAKINYQMLQTLSDMTDSEIQKIVAPTIRDINSVGNDFQTTMRILAADEYNTHRNSFQEAIYLYPELFKDTYHREILKQTKKSLVKQAKAGRLKVNGKYFFVSPDLYAFCEHLFLGIEKPNGLLGNGEVFCREYKDGGEIACLRSPHLYREWAIRRNKKTDETLKWFGDTQCIYISNHDLISKILQADFDGDKLLVLKDKTLLTVAKRNMRDIVPLDYELKKAVGQTLNTDNVYASMCLAFTGGNIGIVSNKITKIWNGDKITQEAVDVVKWLCYENNQVIDYAKTLWKNKPPKEVEQIISAYTKCELPNFFIYAKDKSPSSVAKANKSTMNRISATIPSARIKYCKTIGKFDYRVLLNQAESFTIETNNPIITAYDKWKYHRNIHNAEQEDNAAEDLYLYKEIRKDIIDRNKSFSLDFIVNSLVVYLYTIRHSSMKKNLWNCFGDILVENIKRNTKPLGKVCRICGKRIGENEKCCTN